MYKNWKVENWETPVSQAKSLVMVSLIQKVELSIILQDIRDPQRRRFQFTFSNYSAYRNILEEYRLELWSEIEGKREGMGWTLIIPDSRWIAELKESEALLEIHNPNLVHYMICTEDDVIEVLSDESPKIVEIEPASEDEELPGRTTTLYYPEDKDKIEEVFNEIKGATSNEI